MEHSITLPSDELTIPAASGWAKIPWIAGIVGILGLAGAAALGAGHRTALLYSYLFAFAYFLTIAVGGLFFVLLHYLTRAGWSVVLRRLAECVMGTMPLFVVLAVPILYFRKEIYLWTSPEGDALLEHKSGYLDSGFFIFRVIAYLAVWTILSWYFSKWSRDQDETGDLAITRRLQSRSALGMVLFGVSLNFAAFDLLMSLDPHWFSTIFGVYVFAGSVLAILSTLILLSFQLRASGYLKSIVTWEHYHDLGKLLFAFTVFWAYIGFSQFMLIWYGNIPEETTFFHHRWGDGLGGWQGVSVFLAAGHFGLPFLFLLSSDVKRRRWSLSLAAAWLLFMHLVDVYWLVMPNLALVDESAHGFHPSLVDLACVVGVGGLFLAVLAWRLRGGSLVPTKDPRLAESLAFENG